MHFFLAPLQLTTALKYCLHSNVRVIICQYYIIVQHVQMTFLPHYTYKLLHKIFNA